MALSCPTCAFPLEARRLEGVEVDHCPRCGGTFLDNGEAEQLMGPALATEYWWSPAVLRHVRLGQTHCPKDGELFKEFEIAYQDEEVRVDVCGQCRGIWLERDECKKLRNIVLSAGQDPRTPWGGAARGVPSYFFQLLSGLPLEVWNPAQRLPIVTWFFLLLCLAAFIYPLAEVAGGRGDFLDQWVRWWAMVPDEIRHGHKLWTVLTSIFLHGGVVHLLGNAYFLLILGDNTETALGRVRFARLFLLAGLAGSIAQAAFAENPSVPVIGASGAIAGVLGAYVVLFPRVRLYHVLFFVRFRVPVILYGVIWVGFNLIMAFAHQPRVAWMAHVGGFVAGLLLAARTSMRSLRDRLQPSAPRHKGT